MEDKSTVQILTEVQFEHEYFKGRFSAFGIKPSASSQKVLANFGMILREDNGRFSIYFDVFHEGIRRSREDLLSRGLHLVFSIELVDSSFFKYTALFDRPKNQAEPDKDVFYFSNRKMNNELLHNGSLVSNHDLYPYSLRFSRELGSVKPFGILVLKLGADLRPLHFIKFEALATYWRYILVSDYLKGVPNPVVIDKLSNQVFDGPKSITLASGATGVSFVSPEPIKLSSSTLNQFQLLENSGDHPLKGNVIISVLPNPNHTAVQSGLPQKEDVEFKRKYSEIIIS